MRREKKLRKRTGMGSEELLAVIRGRKASKHDKGRLAKALLQMSDRRGVEQLLNDFFEVEDEVGVFTLALEIENTEAHCAVGPLVRALKDANPHRRCAAARALAWLCGTNRRRRGRALAEVLADQSQPNIVRETAAEGLAYVGYAGAAPTLIAATRDEAPWIRFWSVFALGSYLEFWHVRDAVIAALEEALNDQVHPGESFWPIHLEALAMLGLANVGDYEERLRAELERAPDARWVDWYVVK